MPGIDYEAYDYGVKCLAIIDPELDPADESSFKPQVAPINYADSGEENLNLAITFRDEWEAQNEGNPFVKDFTVVYAEKVSWMPWVDGND